MTNEGKRVKVVGVDGPFVLPFADEAPLDAHRWRLRLDCGHHLTIDASKRPQRTEATCMHHAHEEAA